MNFLPLSQGRISCSSFITGTCFSQLFLKTGTLFLQFTIITIRRFSHFQTRNFFAAVCKLPFLCSAAVLQHWNITLFLHQCPILWAEKPSVFHHQLLLAASLGTLNALLWTFSSWCPASLLLTQLLSWLVQSRAQHILLQLVLLSLMALSPPLPATGG